MSQPITPLLYLVTLVAGWINRHQLDVIEFLREENRALRRQIGSRKLRLTDHERAGSPYAARSSVGSYWPSTPPS